MGNNLVDSLETQGKERIEGLTNGVGSEANEKAVTMTKDRVYRVAGGIQEYRDSIYNGFSFLCSDFPSSIDGSIILQVSQDKILGTIFILFFLSPSISSAPGNSSSH